MGGPGCFHQHLWLSTPTKTPVHNSLRQGKVNSYQASSPCLSPCSSCHVFQCVLSEATFQTTDDNNQLGFQQEAPGTPFIPTLQTGRAGGTMPSASFCQNTISMLTLPTHPSKLEKGKKSQVWRCTPVMISSAFRKAEAGRSHRSDWKTETVSHLKKKKKLKD